MSNVVRLYTLLYAYFFGLRNHPNPRGIFNPRRCTNCRLTLVLAEMRFFRLGFLIPNFNYLHLGKIIHSVKVINKEKIFRRGMYIRYPIIVR